MANINYTELAIQQFENSEKNAFNVKVLSIDLKEFTVGFVSDKNFLQVYFEDAEYTVEYTDLKTGEKDIESTGTTHKKGLSIHFTVGFKTPKGYISSKKLPVDFEYIDRYLTENQVLELLKYNTDAVKNTFDPFYKENEAKSKNAAAWNYIAKNYITDPYCKK